MLKEVHDSEASSSSSTGGKRSTYASLSSQLAVTDGMMLAEDHPLYPVSQLDVIDPRVLEHPIFENYTIDHTELCKMLVKYNRVPGRAKIDLPWQVICLMANGGITSSSFRTSFDQNKIITDLIYQAYVNLDEDQKTDAFGQNPIHFLALAANKEIYDAVCKSKCADKTALNNNGCSVIGYAALSCVGKDRHMLSHLADKKGHNLSREEFVDAQGNRLLHYLARAGAIDVMIHFIRADSDVFDVDANNQEGYAPLHLLLLFGHVEAFKVAFDKFKTLDSYEKTQGSGMNFAHCAAASGSEDGIRFVCEKFPDLRQTKDDNGATIGLHGVRSGSKDFIRFLGAEGYGLDAVDNRGYGAFEYAVAYNKTHLISTIQSKGISHRLPPLRVAAENGQCEAFDKLLKMFKSLDVMKTDKEGLYPIQYAKDDKTRRHIAKQMVKNLLDEVNPFGTKHKLAEWDETNPSVTKTLQKYLDDLFTKAGSWIPKERVQAFIKKIEAFDLNKEVDGDQKSQAGSQKQATKTTALRESSGSHDEASYELVEENNIEKLLSALKEEMVEILVLRAKKSFEDRASNKGAHHKDFIGEYIRFLHACHQRLDPNVEISDEDKKVLTTKEAIVQTAREFKDAIGDKATQLRDDFVAKNPKAAEKIGGAVDKIVEIKDRAVQAYEAKKKKGGEPATDILEFAQSDGSGSNPFDDHSN